VRRLALIACVSCASPHANVTIAAVPDGRPAAIAVGTCVVDAHDFRPDTPMKLLTPSGVVFAEVDSADRLTLSIRRDSTIETATLGLRLVTPARPEFVPVHLRAPHVFGGLLSPGAETELAWTAAAGGAPTITLGHDRRLEWIGPRPSQTIPCADLALAPSYETLDDDPTSDDAVSLEPRAIPIAPTRDAKPVAVIHGGFDVLVLERSGGAGRIFWHVDQGALKSARVIGWIDLAATHPSAGVIGHGSGTGSGMEGSSDWGGCHAEHPIFVDMHGRVERVGDILAGTRVIVGHPFRATGLVHVQVVGPAVRPSTPALALLPGATFAMASADANDCN
jgi:hypothetical protein